MELKQLNNRKWVVYRKNGSIAIITSYKSIAISYMNELSNSEL